MVGVAGLGPATSCSQSMRAANCATPRSGPRLARHRHERPGARRLDGEERKGRRGSTIPTAAPRREDPAHPSRESGCFAGMPSAGTADSARGGSDRPQPLCRDCGLAAVDLGAPRQAARRRSGSRGRACGVVARPSRRQDSRCVPCFPSPGLPAGLSRAGRLRDLTGFPSIRGDLAPVSPPRGGACGGLLRSGGAHARFASVENHRHPGSNALSTRVLCLPGLRDDGPQAMRPGTRCQAVPAVASRWPARCWHGDEDSNPGIALWRRPSYR